jgi:hypothetical protein
MPTRRYAAPALAFWIAVASAPAGAGADDPSPAAPRLAPGRRALAVSASLVPGALLHGAGSWVAGEQTLARRLLWIELAGLGLAAGGGALLLATGASRQHSTPSIAMVVSGIAVFATSWAADIYSAAGGAEQRGAPDLASAPPSLEVGYAYVSDPQFDYSQIAALVAELERGSYRVVPRIELALDGDNQRLRVDASRQLIGERSSRPTGDGSRLELVLAGGHHRYGDDRFATSTGELALSGRLDLARLGRATSGSFADLAVGLAGEVANYYQPGAGADLGGMLLARFAYGLYLGRPGSSVRGEASIYYDHRRDTFAGGISPGPGPGSGFAGFFGAAGLLHLGPRWGARLELEQGAARLVRLSALHRFGAER